eukprot:Hpha_TRINITY_DN2512_c0_g1::TRINITY_DN2512_c0_g1_i1::g.1481::m.1481/K04507/CACYBP, SIP; calcyclin binding protein
MPTEADLKSELLILKDDEKALLDLLNDAKRPGVIRVLRDAVTQIAKRMEEINARLIAAGVVPREDDENPCPPSLSEPAAGVVPLDEEQKQPELTPAEKTANDIAAERKKSDDEAGIIWQSMPSFAFDQSDKFVKVYVTLPGVGSSDHYVHFQPMAFDFRAKGVQGKNMRFAVHNLCEAINLKESSVLVKPDKFVVKLAKLKKGEEWKGLDDVEKKKQMQHSKLASGGATTEELLANMFHDADDKTREELSKAAYEGRLKREGVRK